MNTPSRCPRCLTYAVTSGICRECGAASSAKRWWWLAALLVTASGISFAVFAWLPDSASAPSTSPVAAPEPPNRLPDRAAENPADSLVEEPAEQPPIPRPSDAKVAAAPVSGRPPSSTPAAVRLEVLDGKQRVVRIGHGLAVESGQGILVPWSLLNGARGLRVEGLSPPIDDVSHYTPREFALVKPRQQGSPRFRFLQDRSVNHCEKVPETGAPLWALDADSAWTWNHAGVLEEDQGEEGLLVGSAGNLRERFVFDGSACLVGIGIGESSQRPGRQRIRSAQQVLEQSRGGGARYSFTTVAEWFDRDFAALRDRGHLYAAGSHWEAAVESFLAALRLEPSVREEIEAALTSAALYWARESIRGGRTQQLARRLAEIVDWVPRDPSLLHAWGVAQLEDGDFDGAIQALQDALQQAPQDLLPRVQEALRSAYLRAGEDARNRGALSPALRHLEDGVAQFPDDLSLLKSLGYAYYESGDDFEASRILEEVAARDPSQARSLEPLLARLRLQREQPPQTEIRYDPHAGAIRTNATLNRLRDVPVLVDTGASLTAISESLADRLRLGFRNARRHVEVITASGRVRAPVVTLHRVDLQGAVQEQVDAVVMPLEEPGGSQALIGLNFLSAYDVGIDPDRGLLRLTPLR